MNPAFYVAHGTSGRTRIKWAGDRADKARVIEVAENISAIEGVDKAEPRPSTGSIVIEHEQVEWSILESELAGIVSLQSGVPTPTGPRSGMDTVNRGIDQFNGALKSINTDLGSVTVLMLLILAVTQAFRGQVMSSSSSFLWYALNIAATARPTAATPDGTEPDVSE